jgi:hypothetical protein
MVDWELQRDAKAARAIGADYGSPVEPEKTVVQQTLQRLPKANL